MQINSDRLCLYGLPSMEMSQQLAQWLDENERRKVLIFDEQPEKKMPHARMQHYCTGGWEAEALMQQIAWEGVFLSHTFLPDSHTFFDELKRVQRDVHLFASDFADRGMQVAHNLFNNQQKSVYLARDLEGAFENIPAIICGAGASLAKAADKLRGLKNRALLFSGGAGLTALEHFGIRPHFAGAIDPYPALERLKLTHSLDLPFFYQGRVASDLFNAIRGPKIWVEPSGHFPMEEWAAESMGLPSKPFDGGWNVATFLTAVARRLGCAPIILVGVDLAGDYAVLEERGEKRDWDAAADWLKVRGVSYSLDGLDKDYNFDELLKTKPVFPRHLGTVFQESLARIRELCNVLLASPNFLAQFELEEEVAYQVFCRPVWEVWEHVFRREAGDLNVNKWLFIQRMCDDF